MGNVGLKPGFTNQKSFHGGERSEEKLKEKCKL